MSAPHWQTRSLHLQTQSPVIVSISRKLLISVGNNAGLLTLQHVVDNYVVTTGLEKVDIKDATLHALEDFSYRYGSTGWNVVLCLGTTPLAHPISLALTISTTNANSARNG